MHLRWGGNGERRRVAKGEAAIIRVKKRERKIKAESAASFLESLPLFLSMLSPTHAVRLIRLFIENRTQETDRVSRGRKRAPWNFTKRKVAAPEFLKQER